MTKAEHTFLSCGHGTSTKIELILGYKTILINVTVSTLCRTQTLTIMLLSLNKCEVLKSNSVLSDHNRIEVEINYNNISRKSKIFGN